MNKISIIFCAVFLILLSSSAFAVVYRSWGDSGLQVSSYSVLDNRSKEQIVGLVKGSDNGGYVLYSTYIPPFSSDEDYALARFNENGNRFIWNNDLVFTTEDGLNDGVMASDQIDGGVFVGFHDRIGNKLRYFKVLPDGSIAWEKEANLVISNGNGLITAFSDSLGNFFVVYDKIVFGGFSDDVNVYKFDQSGNFVFNVKIGRTVSESSSCDEQTKIDAISDGAGGFYSVIADDCQYGNKFRKYDSTGVKVYEYTGGGSLPGKVFGNLLHQSGDGGIFYYAGGSILKYGGGAWTPLSFPNNTAAISFYPNSLNGIYAVYESPPSGAILIKTNSSGNTIWQKGAGAENPETPNPNDFGSFLSAEIKTDSFDDLYLVTQEAPPSYCEPCNDIISIRANKFNKNDGSSDYGAPIRIIQNAQLFFEPKFYLHNNGDLIATVAYDLFGASASNVIGQRLSTVSIISVTDAPDPSNIGQIVNFSVNWQSSNNSNVLMKICKGTGNSNCVPGTLLCQTIYDTTNPKTCNYTTIAGDIGTNNYTAWICSVANNCISASSTFTVTPQINQPPTAIILFPLNNSTYEFGTPITFNGSGNDAEDGTLTGSSLQWTREGGINIGSGTNFNYSLLAIGSHTITLTAADSGGLTDTDSIILTIIPATPQNPPNVLPPECSIDNELTYVSCGTIALNQTITNVKASCTDPENNIQNVRFVLTDPIGIEIFNALNSSVVGTEYFLDNADALINQTGDWTLSATCTDLTDLSGTELITWSVLNESPIVSILSPGNPSTFEQATLINFIGSAIDLEEGDLSSSLQWFSNIDGLIGIGASINSSTLSLVSHTIIATSIDSFGGNGSASIIVNIVPPTSQNPPNVEIPECSLDNGSTWISCTNISYNDSITQVRAQCTDPENNISGVNFVLTDPNGIEQFNSINDSVVGSNYVLDNPNVVATIGSWSLTATCSDSTPLTDTEFISWNVLLPTPTIEKIVISNMQVEPFVVRNEQGITTYTTIKNNSNTSAEISLNLSTKFECTFQNQPQTQTLQPRETYTFESMLNFATDCANPLTDTDYWIDATANTQNSSDTYRALFTYKKVQSVAVPETNIMLIPVIALIVLGIIRLSKKGKNYS